MRMNRQRSELIDADTRWGGKQLDACGMSSNDNASPAAKLTNHARSRIGRHLQMKNLVWSCHLTTILTANGRGISILTIFDEHTQECLRSVAANHIAIENLLDELFNAFLSRGIPKRIVTFDDSDLIPNTICQWLGNLELNGTFVESKKYGENGYGILFEDRLIKILLHEKSFTSLADVKLWLANWRPEYNRSINLVRKERH